MNRPREHWSSNFGLVLAATGSAIGLGNLWKFPYITWNNEGGAFVLVYLACILAVGLPIMFAELLIGKRSQKGVVGALKEVAGKHWAAVGIWGVLAGFILLSYYTMIAGWSLFYFAKTAGWTVGGFPQDLNAGELFGEQLGDRQLQLGLSLAFSAATISVVYFGIGKGIERVAKLFLPVLFGILLLMLFSALSMSGAGEALSFIFQPNFEELTWESVLEALGHSFFTLSLGMGAMITYGSYISKKHSVVRAGGYIVALDTAIALIATVIMVSVIYSVAGMREEVGASSVGMLFISLPQLFFTEVPFGSVLAPLFYVLVALAALTSTISLLEVVCAYLIDEHGVGRRAAALLSGGAVFVFTVFAVLSMTGAPIFSTMEIFDGKVGWFDTADHFVANWMLPLGGLFITLAAGWVMSRAATRSELVDGREPKWFSYDAWLFFVRFVAPLAVLAIIFSVIFGLGDFT